MPNSTTCFLSLQSTLFISDLSQCFLFFHFWVLFGSELLGHTLTRLFFSEFTIGDKQLECAYILILSYLQILRAYSDLYSKLPVAVFLDLIFRKFHLVLPAPKPSHQNCPLLSSWEGFGIWDLALCLSRQISALTPGMPCTFSTGPALQSETCAIFHTLKLTSSPSQTYVGICLS